MSFDPSASDSDYREHVRREVENLADGFTRVLFGDYDTVLRAASSDPLFGNLAMLGNVAINSARNAIAEQHRQAVEALQQAQTIELARERLEAILEATQDGLAFFDDHDRLSFHSSMFRELVGATREQLEGRSGAEVARLLSARDPVPLGGLEQAFSTATTRLTFLLRLGRPKPQLLRVVANPMRGAGDTRGRLVVLRDLTALEDSRRFRDELLSNLAHELRTPLTAIQGFTDLLAGGALGALSAAQLEALNTVRGSSLTLARVVDQVLDVQRVESGRVERIDFDLAPVLQALRLEHEPQARAKGLGFRASLPLRLLVRGDRRSLELVFRTLLARAIERTVAGSVELSVGEARDGRVDVRVSDTGPVLGEEAVLRIFERYDRSHDAREPLPGDRAQLELSLVQRFVQLNEGQIALESALSGGTRFRVELLVGADPAGPLLR